MVTRLGKLKLNVPVPAQSTVAVPPSAMAEAVPHTPDVENLNATSIWVGSQVPLTGIKADGSETV